MVLSNAERQARYRKRLKAKASAEQVPQRVREAAEAAVQDLWNYLSRPTADGKMCADLEGFESADAFARDLASRKGGLVETCRILVADPDGGMTPEELASLKLVVDIYDALALADLKDAKRKKAAPAPRG